MKGIQKGFNRKITAIKVTQWLKEWGKVQFDPKANRRRPDPHFYLFTLPASQLKALTGIVRRTTKDRRLGVQDLGIQRRHEKARSDEIAEFIRFGYPWSELSDAKRKSGEFEDLRKPGWLPTAIVVNILKPGDKRRGKEVASRDIVTISDSDEQGALVTLPKELVDTNWGPSELYPIEVIDGQHRLWAFERETVEGDFELPVVAFHGLDISWQAYLFWSINIKPKRINASLAFDLYPLLRTEDWLEKFTGHSIYRETRAQELVEALWAHPESPWHQRINMLGEPGLKQMVSQAAWIRSLMATYVKSWEGRPKSVGGLFGAKLGTHEEVLPWSRAQQAAFLILVGETIRDAVRRCKEPWARAVRQAKDAATIQEGQDPAFVGQYTLLNTDQGIRGILYVTNDLCYVNSTQLQLETWTINGEGSASDEEAVSAALKQVRRRSVSNFLGDIATGLAKYDWRTSSAPGLTEEEQTLKAAFRGSGGYKELRRQLLKHIATRGGAVAATAKTLLAELKYE